MFSFCCNISKILPKFSGFVISGDYLVKIITNLSSYNQFLFKELFNKIEVIKKKIFLVKICEIKVIAF